VLCAQVCRYALQSVHMTDSKGISCNFNKCIGAHWSALVCISGLTVMNTPQGFSLYFVTSLVGTCDPLNCTPYVFGPIWNCLQTIPKMCQQAKITNDPYHCWTVKYCAVCSFGACKISCNKGSGYQSQIIWVFRY
jgi:hypothetical protein